jgi:hypothetical protein
MSRDNEDVMDQESLRVWQLIGVLQDCLPARANFAGKGVNGQTKRFAASMDPRGNTGISSLKIARSLGSHWTF